MQFELRRIISADRTIGVLIALGVRVRPLMVRDYFFELPRGRVMPEFAFLEAATLDILPHEILAAHPDVRLGEVEISPDLTLPRVEVELIPNHAEVLALRAWIRDGAPA